MKLIQLNMWGGRLEKQLENFFASEQPDITCLQEAISIPGNGAIFISPESLQDQWEKPTSLFHSAVFSFSFMLREARFGNAIISTLPMIKTETIFTNLVHKPGFDFDVDDYNIRNLQHAIIEIGERRLNVLNHHGHHVPTHKNGNEDTLRQMRHIAGYIDTLEGPVILTGDFNLAPHSESLEVINEKLDNLSVRYKLETTRTALTHKKEVCDYIFVSEEIKVKDFKASDEVVSDHQALVLEFDI